MSTSDGVSNSSTLSGDGTVIAFHSVGRGPGLVIVGGVLSDGSNYLHLAEALAEKYTVHVMERRGRPGSGPQCPGHSIQDECADLMAIATATGSRAAFGHSFGGLVVLEAARSQPIFDELFVYEPGVPLRGQLTAGWLDGYQQRLETGDRHGAFAWMVKNAGFAPRPLAVMPLWYVRLVLRLAIRGSRWERMDHLLEANLVEHRLQAALDVPSLDRFATIAAHTVLIGGTKSPDAISGSLLDELASIIRGSTVAILPGLGHLAPEVDPGHIATALLTQAKTLRRELIGRDRRSPRSARQPPGPASGDDA
ncbi:MAG: alpha/beta hydrolase [Streptosporangiaceae bacterium]|jgi:pimeloyl-ACP methyl ester carboxylesterase